MQFAAPPSLPGHDVQIINVAPGLRGSAAAGSGRGGYLLSDSAQPALAQVASLGANAKVGNFFPEGSGQIDLMVLLLHEDLANLLRHRVFAKCFALPHAVAVVAYRLAFVLEVVAEHVDRIF